MEAEFLVESGNKKINAKSIMGVISLCINKGESICVVANGKDEKEAVAALEKLANTGVLEA
jgi:phosphotransferase system HPr (HPr) family protein